MRCLLLFREVALLGRQLRLEEIDDQSMLVADKLHHFRRGRCEPLSARLRRNGAAQLVVREQDAADHARRSRRQDVEDDLGNETSQQR